MPHKDKSRAKEWAKEWRQKNPEKVKEYKKKWKEKNPEYDRQYLLNNRDELLSYKKEWYIKNAVRISEKTKKRHSESPLNKVKRLLDKRKSAAKKRGIEFSVCADDVFIPEFCPLLGVRLDFSGKPNNPNGMSIDRIDPSKGYILGNVWVVSYRANRIKNDASLEELRSIVGNLENKMKDNQ